MTKTKLKSVFTREDVYTVLQLLKALADSVDDNEALTDEDIKKLQDKVLTSVAVVSVDASHNKIVLTFADNTTIESVPFESGGATLPQGYEVDSTGKVIINKALNVVSEGDVEVRKNLIVDGKAKINNKNDIIDTSGNILFPDTSLVTLLTSANVNNYKYKYGIFYIRGNTRKTFIIGYISGVNTSYNTISVEGLVTYDIRQIGSCSSYASYDADSITVDYITGVVSTGSIGLSIITNKELSTRVKTYYQHTVHITFGTTGTSVTDICFTALSTNNTKITNYNTLHSVFGGRKITVSGIGKCWSYPGGATMTSLYLDLHGGTISTDKIMGTDSANVLGDPLSTFVTNEGAIVITDDVTAL